MNKPRKNLTESVLARAELYRRGMMFEGVPSLTPELEMPAQPGAALAAPAAAPGAAAAPAVAAPGATDELVAGAMSGAAPLETLLQP